MPQWQDTVQRFCGKGGDEQIEGTVIFRSNYHGGMAGIGGLFLESSHPCVNKVVILHCIRYMSCYFDAELKT